MNAALAAIMLVIVTNAVISWIRALKKLVKNGASSARG